MNYYEILPLKKTGEESRTFTYQSEHKIALGSMVQVPLKSHLVRGLLIEETDKPVYKTRDIQKVLSEEIILTKSQLEVAKKISEYYICSLGETINAFLPFGLGKKRRMVAKSEKRKVKSVPKQIINPNTEQEEIIKNIQSAAPSTTHLIFGVTGSGKTEIYLQLVAEALRQGRGSIILVPEIALTPQTYSRFYERFGDQVAIWHSDLKETEKFATWEAIKSGEKMIVLGARSAIFMPIQNLEYIIIDEEHENSYKQDSSPRYDARKVAEWMATTYKSKVVLGSATPRVESFCLAQQKKYTLHTLNKRIVQESMPPVKIVDLRDEFRKGNKSIVSDALYEGITETLNAKKQAMILLNRRGAATFVVCRDCGYVETCSNCEIPLTYHPSEGQILKCHHCNHRRPVPTTCPECKSLAIKFFGLGTQRAEIELKKLFPKARIVRMDHDTTQKRGSHAEIYHDFVAEKFDILIGTQMIAKGWDLPNVEIVGVISADTMINLPDFRSAERTFSLLTQVAGRTGRGFHPGKVIIQTYNPDNYAVVAAARHDYESFYSQEIESRQKYAYPPYSSLIRLVYSHLDAKRAEEEAQRLYKALSLSLPTNPESSKFIGNLSDTRKTDSRLRGNDKSSDNTSILGPSPCFIEKLAGRYRYQIVIKIPEFSSEYPEGQNTRNTILDTIRNNIKQGWTVDIDPESLL